MDRDFCDNRLVKLYFYILVEFFNLVIFFQLNYVGTHFVVTL